MSSSRRSGFARPYPATVRLCTIASERWAELATAYYPNKILREKPHMFLNLVYAWCIERVEHDKIEEWELELNDLLPWQDAETEAAVNAESDSFMKMMAKQ